MAIVFKDLHKLVSHSQRENTRKELFQRLQNKRFWIWNIEEHKQEDIKTNGDCCFNHIIGLPQKDGNDKALYDYEKIIFDSLVLVPQTSNKHLLDKESNWFRYIRIHASVYGLALFERQYIGRLADVYCNRT